MTCEPGATGVLPWVPIAVQALGAFVTMLGLGWSWWQWTPADENPLRRLMERLRRRPATEPQHGRLEATAAIASASAGRAYVHSDTLESQIKMLREMLDDLRTEVAEADRLLGQRIEWVADDVARQAHESAAAVEQMRQHVERSTREVARDGIGWAAVGVLIGLVGTVLSVWSC